MSVADPGLRPLERAVLRHADAGVPAQEFAWRFRRSPAHIQRVIDLTEVPRSPENFVSTDPDGLRPIERCVLNALGSGIDYSEIAARLRRTPDFVARVEEFAAYKLRNRKGDDR